MQLNELQIPHQEVPWLKCFGNPSHPIDQLVACKAMATNLQKRHTLLRDVAERTTCWFAEIIPIFHVNPGQILSTCFKTCPNQDGRGHFQALQR